ncbi:acyl-CoA thioester hydrolase/BAAT C-terminal domain-containing protein [Actinacidiphila alni]|uniref:acyl-CoA thioester hydrolase/BAAT C-terminal domain-containing protein n=1 Tax=Actinacidiphila alni TaxID=380248 RepID=UPI0033D55D00
MKEQVIAAAPGDVVEGVCVSPDRGSRAGVLVLSGSSGRIEADRCRVLAGAGLTALTVRWFGAVGQPSDIREIPLETFTSAIDLLLDTGVSRIGVLGLSRGAEAALLTAVHDPRVAAVVALSPTSLTWGHVTHRSSWTWRGAPLPYVPYDETWSPVLAPDGRVAYRTLYERSRDRFRDAARSAAIPVERTAAEIVLVAGGADAMWPSLPFAHDLAARRPVTLLTHPAAGHRIPLPGEPPLPPSPHHLHGGTPTADTTLGAAAWPHITATLLGE